MDAIIDHFFASYSIGCRAANARIRHYPSQNSVSNYSAVKKRKKEDENRQLPSPQSENKGETIDIYIKNDFNPQLLGVCYQKSLQQLQTIYPYKKQINIITFLCFQLKFQVPIKQNTKKILVRQ